MISCTEFIPAYSELFTYLEETRGRAEVEAFWRYLFEPDGKGLPLIDFVEREGIRGCFSYWSGTLNEEAADFTMYLNEKAGWFLEVMHRCPSKGRLLELKESIGLAPYRDYCLHCDHYRASVEKVGLKYIYNFRGIEEASCSMLIYDPEIFDGRVIIDEHTEIMDRKAAQNEYFHRDFHSSLNMGVEYLGSRYGDGAVEDYLRRYTVHVYGREIARIRAEGLPALRALIERTYRLERAEDALRFEETGTGLGVRIAYCPAVRHLRATGRAVSRWYPETTRVVMRTLAERAGLDFALLAYDGESGAAHYVFTAGA